MGTEFAENTTERTDKFGYHIACKKGLWEVCGPDKDVVRKEAEYYFWQYYNDGEYGMKCPHCKDGDVVNFKCDQCDFYYLPGE